MPAGILVTLTSDGDTGCARAAGRRAAARALTLVTHAGRLLLGLSGAFTALRGLRAGVGQAVDRVFLGLVAEEVLAEGFQLSLYSLLLG
ncbi:MAG: hypothetical protein IJ734_06815, partial [Fibrobacter sp.]|nr:hypothetical protein [Fibrobacter sp.]